MRRVVPILLLSLLVLSLHGSAASYASDEGAPTGYIVVLRDDIPPEAVQTIAESIVETARGALPTLRLKQRQVSTTTEDVLFRHSIKGFAIRLGSESVDGLELLKQHPQVVYVAEDRRLELDTQLQQSGMQRIRARRNGAAAINDIHDLNLDADIAVLDTGIDSSHPDLNVHRSVSFVPEDPTLLDPHGHGTHVAGIAAAIDDDSGVHGVAPGARLWAVKVVDQYGLADTSDVIAGLDYVVTNSDQIDVVNMSLGGPGPRDDRNCGATVGDPLHQAVCSVVDAGVVVVVSAGNFEPYGRDASLIIPACYDEVITVSAVVETDGLGPGAGQGLATIYGADNSFARTFSNYGWDVDIAAPGVEVISTWPGGGYAVESGTSMAAPHVAGAAAIWISRHGKPTGRAGVRHVRDELVRLAFPQAGPDEGFTGDKETFAEPLLNVAAIDPASFDPVEPRLSTDRPVYEYGQDTEAIIHAYLVDAQGSPLDGIPGNGFSAYLRGERREVQLQALGQGDYTLTLDIADLPPGDHDFMALIRNASGFERSAGCRILIRAPTPRLMIHELAFAWPVMNADAFFSTNPLHATLMDERGAPLVVPTDGFQTTFSAGGDALDWSFPDPDFRTGLQPGTTYGVYRTEVVDVPSLPLGTHVVDLTVTHGGLSDSATATFDVAYNDPLLVAALSSFPATFDFTQVIEPPSLSLRVDVGNEWLTGVSGLLYLLEEPLVLRIDGQVASDVDFTEDLSRPGTYLAADVDLSAVTHGSHMLVVHVTDSRGLQTLSNPITIDVIREGGVCAFPLAGDGEPDADGDGYRDECDNCPAVSNRSQRNTSTGNPFEAHLGDACKTHANLRVSSSIADNPDFSTIQEAIDAATTSSSRVGIEILPSAAPYTETVRIDRGLSFRLIGRDRGLGPPVIVHDGGAGSVIEVLSAGAGEVVLHNLVLRGQGVGAGQTGITTEADVSTRQSGLRFEQLGYGEQLRGGEHLLERVETDATVGLGLVVDDAGLTLRHGEFLGTPQAMRILGPAARAEIDGVLIVGDGSGDGIENDSSLSSELVLRHSTLVDCGTAVRGNAATTIASSILWNNESDVSGLGCADVSWSDLEDLDCGGTNRSVDPWFVDPSDGDYRLQMGSPLLEHGPDPTSYDGTPCVDLDGEPRLSDHDRDGLARVDPGAYERRNEAEPAREVTGLEWTGPATLEWQPAQGAVEYHVYRVPLHTLSYSAFGACADGLDFVRTDTTLTDPGVPLPGQGFFYEITLEDGSGAEYALGSGTCAERSNIHACP